MQTQQFNKQLMKFLPLGNNQQTSNKNYSMQLQILLIKSIRFDDIAKARDILETKIISATQELICILYSCNGQSKQQSQNNVVVKSRTPLMLAAFYGSCQVLDYLLGMGVNVNQVASDDVSTALHCAMEGGSLSMQYVVKQLVNYGAKMQARNINGMVPTDALPLVLKEQIKGSHQFPLQLMNMGLFSKAWQQSELDKPEYQEDEFRMFSFKVAPCPKVEVHDWTECPYLHVGEKARRRDPKKHAYCGLSCTDFRKGSCKRGDSCPFSHGVFESWLHPSKYRTQFCKDKLACTRKVCFFAHSQSQLREPCLDYNPTDSMLAQSCYDTNGASDNTSNVGICASIAFSNQSLQQDSGKHLPESPVNCPNAASNTARKLLPVLADPSQTRILSSKGGQQADSNVISQALGLGGNPYGQYSFPLSIHGATPVSSDYNFLNNYQVMSQPTTDPLKLFCENNSQNKLPNDLAQGSVDGALLMQQDGDAVKAQFFSNESKSVFENWPNATDCQSSA